MAQPADTFVLRMSDMALFRIHVAKITIQNQLTRLKRDANVARRDACHPIEEEWHVSIGGDTILANLDVDATTELRLGWAEDDVHIAQSYMLRYGIYANRVAGMLDTY